MDIAGDVPTRDARVLRVTACGRDWLLAMENMESLWESMTAFATDDERLPYWSELWPSSLALARWLHAHAGDIFRRVCLDVGCGIGFTALIGQWLGARMLAMDYEPRALAFARSNAACNGVPESLWLAMDWRRPALAEGSLDLAWGSDIMYERRFAAPLADFFRHVLRPGGRALLAEPSRATCDSFYAAVAARGMAMRCVHREDVVALTPQRRPVPVRIWQIER
jgi:predicted nicotinamide N-methyase